MNVYYFFFDKYKQMPQEARDDAFVLERLKQSMNMKGILILIFGLVGSFLSYLVFKNVAAIWFDYKRYKHNLNETNISVAVGGDMNNTGMPFEDDEIYDDPPVSHEEKESEVHDNRTITQNLDMLKLLYKPYNALVRKMKPGAHDEVDETMLSMHHDNYRYDRNDETVSGPVSVSLTSGHDRSRSG